MVVFRESLRQIKRKLSQGETFGEPNPASSTTLMTEFTDVKRQDKSKGKREKSNKERSQNTAQAGWRAQREESSRQQQKGC